MWCQCLTFVHRGLCGTHTVMSPERPLQRPHRCKQDLRQAGQFVLPWNRLDSVGSKLTDGGGIYRGSVHVSHVPESTVTHEDLTHSCSVGPGHASLRVDTRRVDTPNTALTANTHTHTPTAGRPLCVFLLFFWGVLPHTHTHLCFVSLKTICCCLFQVCAF